MHAEEAAKKVAKDVLGYDTLQIQNRDSLDFKDMSVGALKAALIAAFKLGQQNPQEDPRWYCFDQADSFGDFPTAAEAATQLDDLAKDGMKGLHMACMTEDEFKLYCTNGKFPFSK